MNAVTKNWLPENILKAMTEKALGHTPNTFSAAPLSGGFCSAVYLINADGEKLVLKVASEDSVKVMRHERAYIPTEADMLKVLNRSADIPMPKLLFYDDSRRVCNVPYFFMSFIEGSPLSDNKDITPEQHTAVQEEMGRITRSICNISAEKFGIPGIPESECDRNSEFVYLLIDWLLLDFEEESTEALPGITPDELRRLIKSFSEILDTAAVPKYIHTDTWAGNVMIKDGKMTGIVDFAAVLYGDPVMSHDFHEFGDAPYSAFLRGYGISALSSDEKIRNQIYRVWHRLGMVVERVYRKYSDPGMYEWVIEEFVKEVRTLEKMRNDAFSYGSNSKTKPKYRN